MIKAFLRPLLITGAGLTLGLLLGLQLPQQSGAVSTVTTAAEQPAATCHIAGYFTFKRQDQPGYPFGLSRYNVTINNCRDRIRAFLACTYIGPRGAQITRIETGNIVIFHVTQVKCAPSIALGWTFNHVRGAGFEFYGSGGPGWHLHWLV